MTDKHRDLGVSNYIRHDRKRGADVHILQKDNIGQGSYGTVYEVEAEVGGKKRTMALKDYTEGMAPVYTMSDQMFKEQAQRALARYGLAKKAGLKVFSTYRLEENGTRILMTNGNDDTFCLASNSETRFKELSIAHIEKFDDLVASIFAQAVLAGEKGMIFTENDIFFFLISKTDTSKIDFVLQDFDTIDVVRKPTNDQIQKNIQITSKALCNLISSKTLPDETRDAYRKLIDDYCNRTINSFK